MSKCNLRNVITTSVQPSNWTLIDTEFGSDVILVAQANGGEGNTFATLGVLPSPYAPNGPLTVFIVGGDGTPIEYPMSSSGYVSQYKALPGGPTYAIKCTVVADSSIDVWGYWVGGAPRVGPVIL